MQVILKNISEVKDCYGCGVCAIACGKKIIDITLNEQGFYVPVIKNEALCTECGLCVEVCSFQHKELGQNPTDNIRSYAAWSKGENVRKQCSSGGVAYEVSKLLIGEGYRICAVRYEVEKGRAEHYIASNIEELVSSKGSKYLQSYTLSGFKHINRREKYLVVGTPCQIDSFRRYIQKFRCEENFILMDFFCHGVPSALMWKKYLRDAERKVGKVTFVSWRNKFEGWHDSYALNIKGDKTQLCSKKSQGDMFYKLFLSNLCLGRACYESCKFKKANSSADIRIGDLWGKTYRDNKEGVSAVIALTEKGDKILHNTEIELVSQTLSVVIEGQLKKPIKRPLLSPIMMWLLQQKISINHVSIKLICDVQMFFKRIETYYRLYVVRK